MRSRFAREQVHQGFTRAFERNRGTARGFLRMSATVAAENAIPDFSKLPVLPDESVLQDEDGNFIFLVGYSAVGGGDIIV